MKAKCLKRIVKKQEKVNQIILEFLNKIYSVCVGDARRPRNISSFPGKYSYFKFICHVAAQCTLKRYFEGL